MKSLFNLEQLISKEVYLHILFWVLYASLPFIKYIGNDYFFTQWVLNNSNTPFVILTAYICYCLIYPMRSNYKIILFLTYLGVITLIGVYTSKYIIDQFIDQLGNYSLKAHIFSALGEYILIASIFYALFAIKRSFQLNLLLKNAELKNLKAQINPHFLFNTLNNIYSYSIKNDKKAPELILKLSDNFKYIFHEAQNEKVELKKDWAHLKDYITISKYRWEDKLNFKIEEALDHKHLLISPLILITFIENAVKYTSKLKGSDHLISIAIRTHDDELSFQCSNPYDSQNTFEANYDSNGIGLSNTIKRLNLLYPKKHSLEVKESESLFVVNLKISLC